MSEGKHYSQLDINIMLGLDDLAHNRLLSLQRDGSMKRIPGYGSRNNNEKCYCKILKELGIKR